MVFRMNMEIVFPVGVMMMIQPFMHFGLGGRTLWITTNFSNVKAADCNSLEVGVVVSVEDRVASQISQPLFQRSLKQAPQHLHLFHCKLRVMLSQQLQVRQHALGKRWNVSMKLNFKSTGL